MKSEDDVFNFILCPICCDTFRSPVLQCVWGHSFCGECILRWLGRKSNCPQCRKPITKKTLCRNILIEAAIEELVLKQYLTSPVCAPKNFNISISDFLDSTPESKRSMLLKLIVCNFLVLLLFFASFIIFFEEGKITKENSNNSELTQTLKSNSSYNRTFFRTSVDEEHLPFQIILNELQYYFCSLFSQFTDLVLESVSLAGKVFLSIGIWMIVKIFLSLVYVIELLGVFLKWILSHLVIFIMKIWEFFFCDSLLI